jgi:predicted flap endonuclease-1-like 5' DNA nuclease
MKDTAPKSLGILAVAAVFGIIGGGVAMVMYGYTFIGAVFVAVVIALIVAVLLWLGWRDANPEKAAAPMPAAKPAAPAPVAKAAEPVSVAKAAAPAPVAKVAAPAPAPAAAAMPTAAVMAPAAKAAPKPKPVPKPKAKAEEPKVAEAPKAAEKPAARALAPDGKPEMLSKPRDGNADDLKQIKGVGPKLEKLLNTMGIWHFDQVAGWRNREVKWVDENLEGFKGRVTRDEWVKQAKILARGGKTAFAEKVKKGDVY